MAKLSDMVVIDIGSKNISAYSAEYFSDENFSIKNSYSIEYSGYMDGSWIVPEEIIPSIVKLIDRMERSSGRIKRVYIGIPTQFVVVRSVSDRLSFPKRKRLTSSDIDDLIDGNDPFRNTPYKRIHAEPVYYLNDRGERLFSPIGKETASLSAQISYVGAKRDVIADIRDGLIRHGVKSVDFIQSEYASALALFSKEERRNGIILADIGYLSTSVLYVGGDALLDLKDFSLGGSMIPLGISTTLNVPFPIASAIMGKINLGYKDEGEYSLKYDANTYTLPIAQVNTIAKESIACVVKYIKKAIEAFRYEVAPDMPIYLTGGGFSEIRFSREYMAKYFDREVEIVQPSLPNYDRPSYSSMIGLMKKAINMGKGEKFGFLKRLFRL